MLSERGVVREHRSVGGWRMRPKNFALSYVWGRPYDENFKELIKTAKWAIDNGDDYRLLIVGEPFTGKTMLMLHAYEEFAEGRENIDQVALNPKGFAAALKIAKNERVRGERYVFLGFDEATVLGREAVTPFNRDLLRLYSEIRGLRIFHVWCTPSPGQLDNAFVDENIHGMIYIFTKSQDRPRLYYYFDRRALDSMRSKLGGTSRKAKLSLDMMRKYSKFFATYKGCFSAYDGVLLAPYLLKKASKMDDRVEDFYGRWGEDKPLSVRVLGSRAGLNPNTVLKYRARFLATGMAVEEVHYVLDAKGEPLWTKVGDDAVLKLYKASQKPKTSKQILEQLGHKRVLAANISSRDSETAPGGTTNGV